MKTSILPLLTCLAGTLHAASVVTVSNPVSDASINTTASNNDRSDWAGTIAFPADPAEGDATDFASITVAHDSTMFYVREQLFANDAGGFLSGSQKLMIDTDQSRTSGYRGASDTFAVGAEYMLEGASLYAYTGTGTDWGWSFVASAVYDDFPTYDHELSFARSAIGNPTAFDLIAITDFFGGGDAYVDGAQGGSSGSFVTYTTVPEPHALLLGVAGIAAFLGRRRR